MSEYNRNLATDDWADVIREIARVLKDSFMSIDQIAEAAGIINQHGDPSRHILYKIYEGSQYPKPGEFRRLLRFFETYNLHECTDRLHNYFFREIGILQRYNKDIKTDGSLDDDLHHLTSRLGQLTNTFLDAKADGRIDAEENRRLMLALDQLERQVQIARKELAEMVDQDNERT